MTQMFGQNSRKSSEEKPKNYEVHLKNDQKDHYFLWKCLNLSVAEVMLKGEVVLPVSQLKVSGKKDMVKRENREGENWNRQIKNNLNIKKMYFANKIKKKRE